MTSSAPVDLVRRCLELFDAAASGPNVEGGRESALEEMMALGDPQVEWHEDPMWPGSDTYRGPAQVVRHLNTQLDEVWEWVRSDVEELIDLGDGRVLALVHQHAKAKAGIPTELRVGHIWTIRDAKVLRVDWFLDQERARAAAGLQS